MATDNYKSCQECRDKGKKYYRKNKLKTLERMRVYHSSLHVKCVIAVRHSKIRDRKLFNVEFLISNGDYINADWIIDKYHKQKGRCFYPNCGFQPMQFENRNKYNGLTIERLDNDLPHTKDNCVIACRNCNCALHRVGRFITQLHGMYDLNILIQSMVVFIKREDGRYIMAIRTNN